MFSLLIQNTLAFEQKPNEFDNILNTYGNMWSKGADQVNFFYRKAMMLLDVINIKITREFTTYKNKRYIAFKQYFPAKNRFFFISNIKMKSINQLRFTFDFQSGFNGTFSLSTDDDCPDSNFAQFF